MASVEHQEYIQKKVNPILESLVTAVLLDKPEDPIGFMITWLSQKTQAPSPEAEQLRLRINALQQEVKELEQKVGGDESEEDDDDDVVDEMPPPPVNKGPRSSVSAEAYGKWNQKKEFVAREIAKSDSAKERIRSVLHKSFLFSGLDPKEVEVVVMAMEEVNLDANQRVIQQGDDGDCLYVIEDGVFHCKIKRKDTGEEMVVKQCEPGDAFGELALLYNCPRAASVDSTTPALMWKLDRETFNAIVKDAASKKREKYEAFLKSVQILKDLGQYEISQLSDALATQVYQPGVNVITQGEPGDTFFIVESGSLYAWKSPNADASLLEYGPGQFFGELALLRNDVRAASVTTRAESKLLFIDRKTFSRLLGPLQELLEKYAAQAY